MKQKSGFTILETSIVITALALLFILFFIQIQNFGAMHRDETRKTAVNAVHYALENSFYTANKYDPESISPENLPVVAPELWTDPSGYDFNAPESDYVYQPANCHQGRCTEYTLRARLEKESDYIKTNPVSTN